MYLLLLIILIIAIAIFIAYTLYPSVLQFTGGFKWPSLENMLPLGSGAFGDVYAVRDGDSQYALKREKIPADWIDPVTLDFKPDHIGEIEFYKFIDTLPQDLQKHFVRLHNYRIFKCDHVHKLADWQVKMMEMEDNKEFNAKMKLRIDSPYCAEYLMDFGGNSLKYMIESGEITPNSKEMRSVIAQLLKIIKIVGDGGYMIDDLHTGNVTILDGICKLIDYGEVKSLSKKIKYQWDLSQLLSMLSGTNEMFQNMPPVDKGVIPKIIDHIRYFKSEGVWNRIYKYIKIMNPNCPDLDTIINNTTPTEDDLETIDFNTGPYLATISLVLCPELNIKYWRHIFPEHTLKYIQYINRDSLLFILDNFNRIDDIINHFNHTLTAIFSTDGKKFYDTVHVWELMKDAPVKNIAVADIEDSLDQPQWDGELSARDVLKDPEAYPEHTTRINNADLSFPILVVGDKKGKVIIADGMHRLAKAYRDGIHYVNIQHIPKKVLKAAIFNIAAADGGYYVSAYSGSCEYSGGTSDLSVHSTGAGPTILLLPGLGNGAESYNWNLSNEEQRQKTGITDPIYASSLQDKITSIGYKTISLDPPGHGKNFNFPANFDKYINAMHKLKPNIIIGHSISGRIAQYYGEKFKIPYIMLDPTPDYLLDIIAGNYTKHIEDPTNQKYKKTHEFLQMVHNEKEEIKKLPWNPAVIIYSVDSNDKKSEEKERYFDNISAKRVKIKDATHWVHITNPHIVIEELKKLNI